MNLHVNETGTSCPRFPAVARVESHVPCPARETRSCASCPRVTGDDCQTCWTQRTDGENWPLESWSRVLMQAMIG